MVKKGPAPLALGPHPAADHPTAHQQQPKMLTCDLCCAGGVYEHVAGLEVAVQDLGRVLLQRLQQGDVEGGQRSGRCGQTLSATAVGLCRLDFKMFLSAFCFLLSAGQSGARQAQHKQSQPTCMPRATSSAILSRSLRLRAGRRRAPGPPYSQAARLPPLSSSQISQKSKGGRAQAAYSCMTCGWRSCARASTSRTKFVPWSRLCGCTRFTATQPPRQVARCTMPAGHRHRPSPGTGGHVLRAAQPFGAIPALFGTTTVACYQASRRHHHHN